MSSQEIRAPSNEAAYSASLYSRLILMVALSLAITLGLFVSLTVWRLDAGAHSQQMAIERLAHVRVEEQMRLQSTLVQAGFERKSADIQTALATLARRPETAAVFGKVIGNSADQLLSSVAGLNGLDGIVAMDRSLRALRAHKPDLDLAGVDREFALSSGALAARRLIESSNLENPQSFTAFVARPNAYLKAFGLPVDGNRLQLIGIQPVRDSTGNVLGVLVAHRILRPADGTPARLGRHENLGIRILEDGEVLFSSGLQKVGPIAMERFPLEQVVPAGAHQHLVYCSSFQRSRRLCLIEPKERLTGLANMLVKEIQRERRSLELWLAALALAALVLGVLLACYLTRRVLAPLQQITRAVRSVARGNWMVHIAGQRRSDEVGGIARAVAVLRDSVRDRERLQADVADVETLRSQRDHLNEMVSQFRNRVRQILFVLSELSDEIDTGSTALANLSALAEGEADEARLIAQKAYCDCSQTLGQKQTDGPMRPVGEAVDRLAETVDALAADARALRDPLAGLLRQMRSFDRHVLAFMRATEGEADNLGQAMSWASQQRSYEVYAEPK